MEFLRTGVLEAVCQVESWVSWLRSTQKKGNIEGSIQGQVSQESAFRKHPIQVKLGKLNLR